MSLKKFSLYVLVASVLVSGCKKQLSLNDVDDIGDGTAFQTFDHVYYGTNGAYALTGAYANNMYISALVSDEAQIGVNNAGQGALTYRYQYSADPTTGGDVGAAYFPYYSLIDQVNRVLPHVYTVSATAAQEAIRDRTKGELLALRAIGHFNLLQLYSKNYDPAGLGVAVMTESDVSAKPSRNTMGEVIAQVDKDLAEAKLLLPAVNAASFSDTAMNRLNVAAFQARVALYKRDWANAITFASEVISSNARPLVTGGDFEDIWTDVNITDEVLFRVRYGTSDAIGSMFTDGASIYIAPSNKLIDSYDPDDIRFETFIGFTGAGDPYVNKFFASPRGNRVVDIKAIRTAEMYLIRAEAYAESTTPNLVAGAADLNTLRAARIAGYVDQAFGTKEALVTAVLEERFKELCFEGFRLWDLKRKGLPVQRTSQDASPGWQTLPATSFRFILPIPQAATLANPNTIQNDGY